jgi:hypothetical protein
MQIIDTGVMGTRSAILRLKRRESQLNFLIFPMLHVASPRFYKEVRRRLGDCEVVVAEGVTSPSVIGAALTLTYRIIPANRRSGLVEQDIDYHALGVEVINPDISGEEFDRGWRALPLWLRLVMWCALPFVTIAQLVGGRKRLLAPDVALEDGDLPDDDVSEKLDAVFGGERDERLFAALAALHETRGHERIDIGIVYGAAHIPVLVHRLAATLGYRPTSRAEWITVVDW